ncbi:UvrB/UvrC motif-containing protein [Parageobacillus thermoglucosidasius]|uniref:UVR domain-containing protein n=2 Tax=Anoxybacillaceae TaxID=3120669 RepID=A0AAN0YLY4_PARTM|nr:UvrB/UvrC motif-containing protein [Parageobacillus thermoglucosidasius]KYD17558.1 hypothetical protein B4168_0020 [Anoxybacillus flavithermus]REK53482.1 MAG: hypothetical protein C6P36_17065 [Geobacillus sp.]AEH46160.1 UvrB/UvrC protein [Parageobacillus thermoglucosidasius C56-YS93]ALF09009.1 hypothetical protein AOT13_02550 [Parageobacillus thermoglucosidasius]ANZ29091.1 hypothetical protein BCV53_02565 [Parageobacillus thermoglucosidasius]
MICQECKQRPATMHFTKIINGEKTEFHLCEQCAHEHSDMFTFYGNDDFSFNNLLSALLNFPSSMKELTTSSFHNPDILQCEKCNMTYQQFTKIGHFGCSHCYRTFSRYLPPILKRLHSGNTAHAGKIPKRKGGTLHLRKQIAMLKQKLQEFVAREEFEKAAEVRDQIRSLEYQLHQRGEGEM